MYIHSLSKSFFQKICLAGSKSISNRLLILNALFNSKISLKNLSNSEDTKLLKKALNSSDTIINVNHAGTAMRFLTSYFAYQKVEKILTGSARMRERPIGILIEALRSMGISIEYIKNEGFPPLKIIPSEFKSSKVYMNANTSSQFITSLMLIAPKLPNGLTVELIGKITSLPYLKMTLEILNKLGIYAEINKNIITIYYQSNISKQDFIIESDWSSASYYYSIASFSELCNLEITSLFEQSIQGDQRISSIYQKYFGVKTKFINGKIILTKIPNFTFPEFIKLDLNDCPDIAQTIAVTATGLKIPILITGLETLKVKETDRIIALYTELKKCGVKSKISNDTLEIKNFSKNIPKIPKIETYNDHRMAMSFTPLAVLFPIEIINSSVVQKSYPNFWIDMNKLGIQH